MQKILALKKVIFLRKKKSEKTLHRGLTPLLKHSDAMLQGQAVKPSLLKTFRFCVDRHNVMSVPWVS